MEQPPSQETATKTISDLLASLRFATATGDGSAATSAALKLRDAARKLTENLSADQSENCAQLFGCIKEVVLMMKQGLEDPASGYEDPMQDVCRRISRFASLIELDQTIFDLSVPVPAPGSRSPRSPRSPRGPAKSSTRSPARSPPKLPSPQMAPPSPPRSPARSPPRSPRQVQFLSVIEESPPPHSSAREGPVDNEPALAPIVWNPPPRPSNVGLEKIADEEDVDLPPAESISGTPMMESIRRYAAHPTPPAVMVTQPSTDRLNVFGRPDRSPSAPPLPSASSSSLNGSTKLAISQLFTPASLPVTVRALPPPQPEARLPPEALQQEINALEQEVSEFRDLMQLTCDHVAANSYPEAKEAIRASHAHLTVIVTSALDHLSDTSDAIILEEDFKVFVRGVGGALNDPATMPSFRALAVTVVQSAANVVDRVITRKQRPYTVMLTALSVPETDPRPSVNALSTTSSAPVRPELVHALAKLQLSGVWDVMPLPKEPYGVLTPNMAALKRVRGEQVDDSSVQLPPTTPHKWSEFEAQLVSSPESIKAIVAICASLAIPNTFLEEVANALLTVYSPHESDLVLLCLAIAHEIEHTQDPTTLFRGASIAPKFATAVTRMWALPYLFHIADPTIEEICLGAELEVDPARASAPEDMDRNKRRFLAIAIRCLDDIFNSALLFPPPLRVMYCFLKHLLDRRCPQWTYRLLGGFYFLRYIHPYVNLCHCCNFLCPVLSAPETLEFRMNASTPSGGVSRSDAVSPAARRSLLLLCKFLQQVGNETPFDAATGGENEQMSFLNEFIVKVKPNMRKFFDDLCDVRNCNGLPLSPFSAEIELREAACQVVYNNLIAAREYFKIKPKPDDLVLSDLERLIGTPPPSNLPTLTPNHVSLQVRAMQMAALQRGIGEMKTEVERRRANRMAHRMGSMMVSSTSTKPAASAPGAPLPRSSSGSAELTRSSSDPKKETARKKDKEEKKRLSEAEKRESIKQKEEQKIQEEMVKEEKRKKEEERQKAEEAEKRKAIADKYDEKRKKEEDRIKAEEQARKVYEAKKKEEDKKLDELRASAQVKAYQPLTPQQKLALKTVSYMDATADCARMGRTYWRLKAKKDWKEAWMVLTKSDMVLFFESGKSQAPYLILSLDKWTYIEITKCDMQNSFQVRNTKDIYYFSVPGDAAACHKWMELFDSICNKERQRAAPSRFQA